ncbi:hypothetical protein Tco_1511240 [Tanacetum coccineum]
MGRTGQMGSQPDLSILPSLLSAMLGSCSPSLFGHSRNKGWDVDKRGPNMQSSSKGEYSTFLQTLEELHLEYTMDAMMITNIRDKDEDEENDRPREIYYLILENYVKMFVMLRGIHGKQWEEFLQVDAQRRQQRMRQPMAASGFRGYKQDGYSKYEYTVGIPNVSNNMPMDLRVRYPDDGSVVGPVTQSPTNLAIPDILDVF